MSVINSTQVIFDCSCRGQISGMPCESRGNNKRSSIIFLWKQLCCENKAILTENISSIIKRIQTSDSMICYQMWPWKCKEWVTWKDNLSFYRNSTPFILAACLLMCWYTFCLENWPAFIWMTEIPRLLRE